MKTKVYILVAMLAAIWLLAGVDPDIAAGKMSDGPPAAKGDKPKDDDGAPMAGPRHARSGDRDRADDDGDDFGPPPRDREDRQRGRFQREDRRDRRHPGWRDRMRRGPDEPVPADVEAEALKVLKERLPDFYERLIKLRDEKPTRYQWALRHIMPMMNEFMDLQREHPEMADVVIEEFKVERSIRMLIRQYRDARKSDDAEARAKLEGEFRELMTHRHELEMRRRQFRLDDFRERLERERQRLEEEQKRLKEDESHFAEDLDRRVEQLREGDIRKALGPPPGKEDPRRRRFDGPPRRGRHRGDADGPPPRGLGPRGQDEPPPREGERPPPDDDLDI